MEAVAAAPSTVDAGASDDKAAISEAADDYQAGDATAAADLADAASATDAVPMTKTKNGLTSVTEDGAKVAVAKDGDVTLSAPGAPKIGIGVAGDADTTKVIDGALVQTEVAPSTDIVTRATEDGVQMVAVLGDGNAPSEIRFPFELPQDAKLVERGDGSVAVIAEVTRVTISDEERQRIEGEITAIVGDAGLDEVTPEQLVKIEAIPDAESEIVTAVGTVATIGAPWAVDADGTPLATNYVIDGETLVQVVHTDASTTYPVTADPGVQSEVSWWEWVTLGLGCLAELAATLFVAAKMVKAFAKADRIVNAAKKLVGAYKALGNRWDRAINKIIDYIKDKKRLTKVQAKAVEDLVKHGGEILLNAIGLGTCGALFFKAMGW